MIKNRRPLAEEQSVSLARIANMTTRRVPLTFLAALFLASVLVSAQDGKKSQSGAYPAKPKVCSVCIRAHEEFLASDAMQGRGSGTHDELVTATYIAAELRAYGIAPAGDDGGYIQAAPLLKRKLIGVPTLEITPSNGAAITLNYGKDFLLRYASSPTFSGALQKVDTDKGKEEHQKVSPGAVLLVTGKDPSKLRHAAFGAASAGDSVTVLVAGKAEEFGPDKELPTLPNQLAGAHSDMLSTNFLEISSDAAKTLGQMDDGTKIRFTAPAVEEKGFTWNAVGILKGTDPKLRHEAILLSAHLDHLGIGQPVNGDSIYNGADDDASGTTAVLELARVLGAGPRPKRTVIFALFGSEESGGLGSTYFREHPPIPLEDFAANLEFEMIGRADAKVPADTLWLTGWERSNLGPTLAAHGANLVGDPHPDQNFFARSDNYVLAKKGVIAQTVSSYGLHSDYHRPSDDLAHLDFKHMDAAIGSMLAPVEWLVNSDFIPQWNKGGQP